MNLLDILIICTMIFLIVKGLLRGFIREIASLAGVILGILLGSHFQPQMTELLKQVLNPNPFLSLISFGVVFVMVLVACNLLGWLLNLAFKKALLGWVDRLLGLAFALLKGVLITYLAIVILTFFLPSGTPLIARSRMAPWIIVSYQSIVGLISPDHYQRWKKKFMEKKEELGDKLPGKTKEPPGKDE
ncbi:MAG: CvpA family protein [Deltaproteobacteria bacterium]|nr:CvpA family protein [Deltaproteobacteria bacterium]